MGMRRICVLFALAVIGCSSNESPPTCEPTCAADPLAPKFEGVASVAPDAEGTNLRITWKAATDDTTQPAAIRYRIYSSIGKGKAVTLAPVLTTEAGATSAYLRAGPQNVPHYVVVRALDADGRQDNNAIEKSAVLAPDTTAPEFAGIKSAKLEADGNIVVTWDAARDTQTPAEGMRYVVYGGVRSIDLTAPLARVDGGTEARVKLGAPNDTVKLLVRAVDAAENQDSNNAGADVVVPPDSRAPDFLGCQSVVTGATSLLVSWEPASDGVSPVPAIAYDVYLAESAGAQQFTAAPAISVVGRTNAFLRNLTPSKPYFVVCRARDEAGNRDANTNETNVMTSANQTAPTFAGVTTVSLDPVARAATLSWDVATDDLTPTAQIVYDVFESMQSGSFDFTTPRVSSVPGATSVVVPELAPNKAIYWIVRARDTDLNLDTNVVEVTGTTYPSFLANIEPIFLKNCAVVGCHTSASMLGGMSLSPAVAYDSIVNVNANQRPPGWPTPMARILPFNTDESYLYRKILGVAGTISANPMPAPGTGNTLSDEDKATIRTWIEVGAPRN